MIRQEETRGRLPAIAANCVLLPTEPTNNVTAPRNKHNQCCMYSMWPVQKVSDVIFFRGN